MMRYQIKMIVGLLAMAAAVGGVWTMLAWWAYVATTCGQGVSC